MTTRAPHYDITTSSGRSFNLLFPSADDLCIEDIATSLSRIPRFNGHTPLTVRPYSVAQHCLKVADMVPALFSLEGLLHDAHEAYLGDLTRPVINAIGRARIDGIKRNIDREIMKRFNVDFDASGEVISQADDLACMTERRAFQISDAKLIQQQLGDILTANCARDRFLERFHELQRNGIHHASSVTED